jgi:hypothetical protein
MERGGLAAAFTVVNQIKNDPPRCSRRQPQRFANSKI